jgi:hypothetical protein
MIDAVDQLTLSSLSLVGELARTLEDRLYKLSDDPQFLRRSILVVTGKKLEQQIRAFRILTDADCLEEAVGLGRVIVEVVINALYLQEAEDEELASFMSFDSQKIAQRLAKDHRAEGASKLAEVEEARLAVLAGLTGRIGTELTWSRRSPSKRAQFFDNKAPFQALHLIHDTISRVSNFSLHGTFISMAHLLPLEAQAGGLFPQRLKLHHHAVGTVSHALRIFAHFADIIMPNEPSS